MRGFEIDPFAAWMTQAWLEITFADIVKAAGKTLNNQTFAKGAGTLTHVTLPGGGGVFLLHPPGFFILEALWELVTGRPTEVVDQVIRGRYLTAVLAVITTVVIFYLGRRLAGRALGAVAAALFILDPFVLRQNDLVFIETPTMLWLVVGLLLIVRVIQGAPRRPRLEVALAISGSMPSSRSVSAT